MINVPNPDILRAALAHIEADPSKWSQDFWGPGVGDPKETACLCGHILLAHGWTWEQLGLISDTYHSTYEPVAVAALKLMGFDIDFEYGNFRNPDTQEFYGRIIMTIDHPQAPLHMCTDPNCDHLICGTGQQVLRTGVAQFALLAEMIFDLTGVSL